MSADISHHQSSGVQAPEQTKNAAVIGNIFVTTDAATESGGGEKKEENNLTSFLKDVIVAIIAGAFLWLLGFTR